MAVPDYQQIMLPLLKLAGDGKKHSLSEAIESLAQGFILSEKDRSELLGSGRQYRFNNRVGWARTYMKKAGLLDSPERGFYKITQRGLEVLAQNPTSISNKFLSQFPEFREFTSAKKSTTKTLEDTSEDARSPEERLEDGYQELYDGLALELLQRIKSSSAAFFERLVVDLLLRMGYGGSRLDAGTVLGRSGDGGLDGVIKEDKLGLDEIYIQAKKWESSVGEPAVRDFVGGLSGAKATRGVFITTSQFTKDAKRYVSNISHKVILIDGQKLAQLMIDNDLGVTKIASYDVKRLDSDYYSDE